jgi:hypothetical protein
VEGVACAVEGVVGQTHRTEHRRMPSAEKPACKNALLAIKSFFGNSNPYGIVFFRSTLYWL